MKHSMKAIMLSAAVSGLLGVPTLAVHAATLNSTPNTVSANGWINMSLSSGGKQVHAEFRGCNTPNLHMILHIIGGKWKAKIVCNLMRGRKRFGELRRLIPGITQRVLTLELRQLEKDGIVVRRMYPTIPPKVEYSLTDRGRNLELVFTAMGTWAQQEDIPGVEE